MSIRSAIGHHPKVRAITQSTGMIMRILVLLVLCAALTRAQVPAIGNQLSPAFRADLNTSLQNAASITGSYSNPAWITALAGAKITGNIAGNAGTATALAALPTACSAGNYPLGILANGNATGCTAAGGAQASIFSAGTKVQRSVECAYGTVASTALTAAATSQEITIQTGLLGAVLYDQIQLSETTQFTGATGLAVSMGRPGVSTHAELTAGTFALGVSSGESSFLNDRPTPPQVTSTYSLVLNFTATSGNVNAATAGGLKWKVCGYASE